MATEFCFLKIQAWLSVIPATMAIEIRPGITVKPQKHQTEKETAGSIVV